MRTSPILIVVGCCAAIAGRASAQEPAFGRHRLSLATGALYVAQRDANASPLAYGGAGPSLDLTWTHRGARGRSAIEIGFAIGTLTSATTTNDLPRERSYRMRFAVEKLRYAGTARGMRWLLGARLSGGGALNDHFYADPGRQDVGYVGMHVGLGPCVSAERPLGRAALTVSASLPLLSVVARPYSDVRLVSSGGLSPRVVTLLTYQNPELSASYAWALGPRVDAAFTYRAAYQRLSDDAPYRSATQALAASLALKLGRLAP